MHDHLYIRVGRPYTYGLALGGDVGAAHFLKCLLAEADLLMAVKVSDYLRRARRGSEGAGVMFSRLAS